MSASDLFQVNCVMEKAAALKTISIHEIVKKGSLSDLRIKLMEDSSFINTRDETGLTPLHVACSLVPMVPFMREKRYIY